MSIFKAPSITEARNTPQWSVDSSVVRQTPTVTPVQVSPVSAWSPSPNTPTPQLFQQKGDVLGATTGGGGSNTQNTPQNEPPAPTEPSAEQREVDNAYRSAMDYLGQAESMIKGLQPQLERSITDTYTANQTLADTQKGQSERQIGSEKEGVNTRLQNAITAARQALSESLMGGKQRFGAGSNIYKALGEYGTTKFQQAAGSARDVAERSLSQLNESWQSLQENYTQQMQSLNAWRTQTMAQLQSELQDKLLNINSQRRETEQNKSIQRIQILQDMRNRADAIKNQAWTFQQNLEMQRQNYAQQFSTQAKAYTDVINSQANQAGNMSAQGTAAINLNPLSASSVGGGETTPTQMGSIRNFRDIQDMYRPEYLR
jgi:hypothetical protein